MRITPWMPSGWNPSRSHPAPWLRLGCPGTGCRRPNLPIADRKDYQNNIRRRGLYSPDRERTRCSLAEVVSTEVLPIMVQPDPERICTSIIQRQNLSVRTGTRRFSRLTNIFSKEWITTGRSRAGLHSTISAAFTSHSARPLSSAKTLSVYRLSHSHTLGNNVTDLHSPASNICGARAGHIPQ